MSKLEEYLEKPVSDLIAESPRVISDEEKERLRTYSLLLMSIVAFYWNSNKRGLPDDVKPSPAKDYGTNPLLSTPGDPYRRGGHLAQDYLGHNIAAFAADRDGYIIDFDFNHNEIFNNSTQHAEARLLNRTFSLNQVYDSWNIGAQTVGSSSYGQLLKGVTIFTSLESCAQCSGIMTLGNAKEVIYLQDDPGQYKIGNIMFRLTESNNPKEKALAPRPVPASTFGFGYHARLSEGFAAFKAATKIGSITSFLCSEAAFLIFLAAEAEFHQMAQGGLQFPEWKVPLADGKQSRLSNSEVLEECLNFYRYAVGKGRRGTPH